MATPSRGLTRAWPFALNWISLRARSSDKRRRNLEEYIAGIGMLQANEERRRKDLPLLEHAIIITGIHYSSSDGNAHVTLAAATREMRAQRQHIAVHSRVAGAEPNEEHFIGSVVFADNTRDDTRAMRDSYVNPVPARISLMPENPDSAPVGYTVDYLAVKQWYILNDDQEMVFLEPDKFFTVGQGAREYLAFWNPILDRPCRAIFLGYERPKPHSPDLEPTNLEGQISQLSIAAELPSGHQEWVKPVAKLGKDMKRSVCFETNDGREVRTSWQSWERIDGEDITFRCKGRATENEYWATYLPAELVQPWWDPSSDRPIHFKTSESATLKTKRKKWLVRMDSGFYVYLEESAFYLAFSLPSAAD